MYALSSNVTSARESDAHHDPAFASAMASAAPAKPRRLSRGEAVPTEEGRLHGIGPPPACRMEGSVPTDRLTASSGRT